MAPVRVRGSARLCVCRRLTIRYHGDTWFAQHAVLPIRQIRRSATADMISKGWRLQHRLGGKLA